MKKVLLTVLQLVLFLLVFLAGSFFPPFHVEHVLIATPGATRVFIADGLLLMVALGALTPKNPEQERRQKNHNKDEEQDLRNFGRATRDPAKAEESRDDRDDEKDDSVTEHEALQEVGYRNGSRAG